MNTVIAIHTEPLPEAFRWDPRNPVTGTNKFYVNVADALSVLHVDSVVIYDGPDLNWEGIQYRNRETWRDDKHCDVILDCNQARPATGKQRRLQWTNFYDRPICTGEGYERLFVASNFHWSLVAHYAKAPVTVLPLGTSFPVVSSPDLAARPKRCCYTSAPDRGARLLQQIWPHVEAVTGWELAITPYGKDLSDAEVMGLLDKSAVWLHPAMGVELYCLSGIEAQARGCVPFYVPHMALAETVRYGQKTDLHRFKPDLIRFLTYFEAGKWESARAEALTKNPLPTWLDTATEIAQYI